MKVYVKHDIYVEIQLIIERIWSKIAQKGKSLVHPPIPRAKSMPCSWSPVQTWGRPCLYAVYWPAIQTVKGFQTLQLKRESCNNK